MAAPLVLPPPSVKMFTEQGQQLPPGRDFLDQLRRLVTEINAAVAALQAAGTAPPAAQYLTLATHTGLSAERVATAGSGVAFTDAGANAALTIAVDVGVTLQTLQTTYATNANITTLIPLDDTIPTITEGDQIMSLAITTAAAANKVRANVVIMGSVSSINTSLTATLWRGSTLVGVSTHYFPSAQYIACVPIDILDAPGAAAAHTYTVRVGPSSNTARLNGTTGARVFGGASLCTLTLSEIKG